MSLTKELQTLARSCGAVSKEGAAEMPKPVEVRSAMMQQEATEASKRKETSNAATDEMPQPVGS